MSAKTYLGSPCRRGHQVNGKCLRYVGNGNCVQCFAEAKAHKASAAKQHTIASKPESAGGMD